MSWLRRLWNTIRPGRIEREIQRELAFHIAERVDQLQSEGLSEHEATQRAQVQFGNVRLQGERTRDMDVSVFIDGLQRDLSYAVRALRRTPGFTLTVVITLALGIGANSAVFSALDAVLLRPLPFPDGDRLMELRQRLDGTAETSIAPVRLEDWHALNSTFTVISGYYTEDVSETSGDFPERVKRALVAPRFLELWGIEPALGRGFTIAEHRVGGPPAIVISHRYWRDRLGSDPHALARTVRIANRAVPIVGVMPSTFMFPDRAIDLWSPVAVDSKFAQSRRSTWYQGIGRLKPGVTVQQARANLAAVQGQLARQHPETDRKITVDVTPLKERAVGSVRRSLWLLFSGVSVLLLITCANIAALLLSRAAHRRHELSVRVSLGASRLAVAAQVLIETLVLTMTGGLIGLLVASAGVAVLRYSAADVPRTDEIVMDWRVALYTLASAVFVALLCGMLPAARASRDQPIAALQTGGRPVVSTRSLLQWWLVGAQVALSVTLLANAGLLFRSFQELWRVDAGFNPGHVLAFRVSGNWAETVDQHRLRQRIDGTLEKLRALPGIDAAATTGWSLPGVPTQWETTFALAEARSDNDRRLVAELRSVSPDYFATMQIPVVAGELCRQRPTNADGTHVPREVMVNRAFAEQYLAGWAQPSIGLHLTQVDGASSSNRIVGIVGDARERGLDRPPGPTVYWCDSVPNSTPYFLVRTHVDAVAAAQMVRASLKDSDPLRAVYDIGPLDERIDGAFAQNRLRTTLLALFAMAALLLTCIGIYGTLSYALSIRRREVGVRLALGAMRMGVARQFLVQSLRVVGVACVCGLGLTMAFSQMLAGMLYGISRTDPFTLITVIVVVSAVATVAAVVPAVRAARLDPAEVLREG